MPETRVDLAKRRVHIAQKTFWYRYKNDDEDDLRLWYTHSKKYVHIIDDYGEVDSTKKILRKVVEARESRGEGAFDCRPARLRIKKPKRLKSLNKLVDQAEADKKRQSKQAKKEGRLSNSSDDDPEKETIETIQDHDNDKKMERLTSVSFALKSAKSDFVLNIRVAPSKKNEPLYNVSVHLGSKFVGYVEVPLETVVEMGRRLTKLQ